MQELKQSTIYKEILTQKNIAILVISNNCSFLAFLVLYLDYSTSLYCLFETTTIQKFVFFVAF